MAIKIKRSTGNLAPAELAAGQLAYSEGSENGGTLYYGEIGGTVREIAGKKYVDKLNGIEAGAEVNTVNSVNGQTGTVVISTGDLASFNADVDARITNSAVVSAIGYTPADAAEKGAAFGIATLDSAGLVPSTQLPSYVDDVLEYADLAGFPLTGEASKIYVAVDTGKTYRWSGTVYTEISASPGTTDAVTEGLSNLYYTDSRARAAISVTQNLTYDNATGVITGPDLSSYLTSETDPVFSASAAGSITSTQVSNWDTAYGWGDHAAAGYIDQVSNDTAPQLGGALDTAGYDIISTINNDIKLSPDGTGSIVLNSTSTKVGKSTGNGSLGSQAGNLVLQGQITATPGATITLNGGTNAGITISPAGTGTVSITKSTTFSSSINAPVVLSINDAYTSGNQVFMAQSHSTADANNIGFARTRGTFASQQAVQTGDELLDFTIFANDGSATTTAGLKTAYGFSTVMTDAATTNNLPTRTDWYVNTGSSTPTTYHQIGNDLIARFKEIGAISGQTNLNISAGTNGNITLTPNGSGKVVISGLSYPTADGTNGYVLTTNGAGVLSWSAQSSGVTTFVALTDTPSAFTGSAGYYVKVNSGATALEFSQDVDDGSF